MNKRPENCQYELGDCLKFVPSISSCCNMTKNYIKCSQQLFVSSLWEMISKINFSLENCWFEIMQNNINYRDTKSETSFHSVYDCSHFELTSWLLKSLVCFPVQRKYISSFLYCHQIKRSQYKIYLKQQV